MDDSCIPVTNQDWFDWLSHEEEKTCNAYIAKPENLIADYHKELDTTRDYEGREILELLQNAADQARAENLPGKVIIELFHEGLVIANNGEPFSTGGVLSLENAYLSPKRHKLRQYIGNKGLGFRSVLNWTNSPLILSGMLNLAYSPTASKQKLDKLMALSSDLAALVNNENRENNSLVIPVLPFPGYSSNGSFEGFIQDENARLLLTRCAWWRTQGYTTAIGMPFLKKTFYEAAHAQIKALRPEILLFVDHLQEIRFFINGEDEQIWSLEGNDNAAMVMDNDEPLGIWQVFRADGKIPEEKLDKDQDRSLSYELIIAVPEVESFNEFKVSPLFSHFPTRITLPLPVVCHATLELNQNRNQIIPCSSNRYVLEQLAIFLVKVAEIRAVNYPSGQNAGFRLLMTEETYPSDLIDVNFSKHLEEYAKKVKIIPTLKGDAVLPEGALSVPYADKAWLPNILFGDIYEVDPNR